MDFLSIGQSSVDGYDVVELKVLPLLNRNPELQRGRILGPYDPSGNGGRCTHRGEYGGRARSASTTPKRDSMAVETQLTTVEVDCGDERHR